jgi:hypothetical protein
MRSHTSEDLQVQSVSPFLAFETNFFWVKNESERYEKRRKFVLVVRLSSASLEASNFLSAIDGDS